MADKKGRIYLDGAWRYFLDDREIIDEDNMASNSATRVPTQQSVKAYADSLIAAADAMVFKGSIDCSGNPDYPAADCGHTYKISVAGKIGGASGVTVEAGDTAICTVDSSVSGDQATVGANWVILETNIDTATLMLKATYDTNDDGIVDYATIAYSCDSGATLPVSPVDRQWFLHEKTYRRILYQYDANANWVARMALNPAYPNAGEIKIYVDGTLGTDDMEHGDGVGTDALRTIGFVFNSILAKQILSQIPITIYCIGSLGSFTVEGFDIYFTVQGIGEISSDTTFDYTHFTRCNSFYCNNVKFNYPLVALDCAIPQFAACEMDSIVQIRNCTNVLLNAVVIQTNDYAGNYPILEVNNSYVQLYGNVTIDGIDKTVDGVEVFNNGVLDIQDATIENCNKGIVSYAGGVVLITDLTLLTNNIDKDLNPHSEYVKIASGNLAAGNANAFSFAWQNPSASKIIITRVVVDVTTPGGTPLSLLDVGSAASATTHSDNLIDGMDLNTAGVYDNLDNPGTNGKSKQKVDANGDSIDWVTGQIMVMNAASLVGKYYIHYTEVL